MKCPRCDHPMQFEDYPKKQERMWVCLNPECGIRTITEWLEVKP
jgi:hypothetical protein